MEKKNKIKQDQNLDVEKCVFCGQKTNIKVTTPIKERYYYIEGSGQLCSDCYYEFYVKKNK